MTAPQPSGTEDALLPTTPPAPVDLTSFPQPTQGTAKGKERFDEGFIQGGSRRLLERYVHVQRAIMEGNLTYRIIGGQLRDLGATMEEPAPDTSSMGRG